MKRAASAAFVLLAASAFGVVDLSFVSDGPIVPGEWNSNYLEGMAYADAHNIPVFSIYGATDCGNTKAYLLAIQKDDVRAWIRKHPIVLLCSCDSSEVLSKLHAKTPEESPDPDLWHARQWCKTHAPSMDYPIAGLHWLKPDGKTFDFAYIGRSSQIPRVPGFGYSGLVSELTVRLLDYYFGDYRGGDVPVPEPDPERESDFGKRELTYGAVACDDETGFPEATVSLKAKKANSRGLVSVSGSAVTSEGRKYSVKATVDRDDPHMTVKAGGLGTLSVGFGADGIEEGGTLGDLPLTPAWSVGKTLPYAVGRFSFDGSAVPDEIEGYAVVREALPTEMLFASGRNPWVFPKKGSVSWSTSAKQIVIKGDNPSGLKLTYSTITGHFKGDFYIYGCKEKASSKAGRVSGYTVKRWKVKVSGLVADGEGAGKASTTAFNGWFPVFVDDGRDEED